MFGRGHNLCFMSEPTVNKLILKYCDTCSLTCNDYNCLKVGGVEVVTELGLSQSHKAETLYSLARHPPKELTYFMVFAHPNVK